MWKAVCLLAIGALLAATSAADAQSYTFTLLKAPNTIVNGINDSNGMVVDTLRPTPGCTVVQGHKSVTLRAPDPRDTVWCNGISNAGTTIGYLVNPDSTTTGFFKLNGSPLLDITRRPVYGATPYGVSDIKQNLAGVYYDTHYLFHGYTIIGGNVETFEAPGAVNTYVTGINDSGTSIMYSTNAQRTVVLNYIKRGNNYTKLNFPGALYTQPSAINNAGIIVGSYVDKNYLGHGMVYDSAKGIYYTVDVPGTTNTAWHTINNKNSLGGTCSPNAKATHPLDGGGTAATYGVYAVGKLP